MCHHCHHSLMEKGLCENMPVLKNRSIRDEEKFKFDLFRNGVHNKM